MPSWLPVDVRVALDGWPAVRGVLLDASAEGAGLLIPADMDGMVLKRDAVELSFRTHTTIAGCEVQAKIVGDYGVEEGYRRYGLSFEELDDELADELGQIFNRRRHPRVTPPKRTAVDVVRPDAPVESLRAGLRDLSESGVSLAIPASAAPPLDRGTSLILGVTLATGEGDARLWRLAGEVRRETEEGGRRIIGVELQDSSRRLAVEHALRSWRTDAEEEPSPL